jgi:Na+-transporting methylmalonyl-CoA/oxaloacetate decarboxylase gamma subunit
VDNFTFGWTMTVLGMGITFLTLWLLTLVISLISKLFPYVEEEPKK